MNRCCAPLVSRAGALLALGLALVLSGCSRSVSWREEVQLNTGETIWVQRSGSYRAGSESGNPLVFAYNLEPRSTIQFAYRGKQYVYESDGYLQVLAISPSGVPNLLISAADLQWQLRHNFRCARPSYVQLRPDATGRNWQWPVEINQWLYGLPTNLLMVTPRPGLLRETITSEQRAQQNSFVYVAGEHFRRIDPTYQHPDCKRRS